MSIPPSSTMLSVSFMVEDTRFLALQPPKEFSLSCPDPPLYVTVISVDNDSLSVEEAWVEATIASFEKVDDVFRREFLSGVIFAGTSKVTVSPSAEKWLRSIGTTWVEVVDSTQITSNLPQGSYYVLNNQLHEICRLYEDSQGAFLTSFVPGLKDLQVQLRLTGEGIQTISVAVSSRLKSKPTASHPLSGWRIAVKDIFWINGIKTSLCNKAYYELYPPASKTAACITLLEDKGACLLGTTKLTAFAGMEEPIDCIDYQSPWNPRADGHQSPASSSSGSGVAVASYDWVDIAIGSDTCGSIRKPGHWNGCFAHRPSHGLLPADGFLPSFTRFDTPGFFGRDLKICKEFANSWYGERLPNNQRTLPFAIVYPTEYMALITNEDQLKIINQFTADLENSMEVKQERVSFSDLWDANPPEEAKGQSWLEYMKDASLTSFLYDDYHHLDKFRGDYQRKFSKTPYVSPPVSSQWNLSTSISKEERDEAVGRLEVYREWCSKHVLRVGSYNTVVLIPIENMSPRYRDEPLESNSNPVAVPMLHMAPILKAPEFIVPIGEVPFQSKVTGNIEKQPVAISMLGAPGYDLDLMDIAQNCLVKSGRPTRVLPGTKLF